MCLYCLHFVLFFFFFFFNDTATTEIYTLSLHDALPIWRRGRLRQPLPGRGPDAHRREIGKHTSELQSHHDLVCRLLLEKKKKKIQSGNSYPKKQKKYTTNKRK